METNNDRKSEWLPWLLMGIGMLLIVILLSRGCDDSVPTGVKSTVHGSA